MEKQSRKNKKELKRLILEKQLLKVIQGLVMKNENHNMRYIMKTFTATFLLLLVQFAMADPATSIDLSFSGNSLSVTVVHPTGNVSDHFIQKLEISVGDSLLVSETFSEQQLP